MQKYSLLFKNKQQKTEYYKIIYKNWRDVLKVIAIVFLIFNIIEFLYQSIFDYENSAGIISNVLSVL